MTLDVRSLTGADLDAALDDVARLRIAVFRDWPYLYDGDLDYERRYLSTYRDSPGAILVWRLRRGAPCGCRDRHADGRSRRRIRRGLCQDRAAAGARVLLRRVRAPARIPGQGIGHRFFDAREAQARRLGRSHVAFCSVKRPDDHPARPAQARTNDAFWRKRGYAPLPGVMADFAWKDLGEREETRKPLQFWLRALPPS